MSRAHGARPSDPRRNRDLPPLGSFGKAGVAPCQQHGRRRSDVPTAQTAARTAYFGAGEPVSGIVLCQVVQLRVGLIQPVEFRERDGLDHCEPLPRAILQVTPPRG